MPSMKTVRRIGDAVAVGVLENQDAAVAGVREPAHARLVVAVLGDPQPSAVVPAERHRLRDHRLGSAQVVDGVAVDGRHPRHRLRGRQELGFAAFALRDRPTAPASVGDAVSPLNAAHALRQRHVVDAPVCTTNWCLMTSVRPFAMVQSPCAGARGPTPSWPSTRQVCG